MLIYSENGVTTFGDSTQYKRANRRKRSSIRTKVSKGGRRTKRRRTASKKVKKVKKVKKSKKTKNLTSKNKLFLKTLGYRVKKQ